MSPRWLRRGAVVGLVVALGSVPGCGGGQPATRVTTAEVASLRPGQSLDVSGTLVTTDRTHLCVRDSAAVICAALDPPHTTGAYNPMAHPFDLKVGTRVKGTIKLFAGPPRFVGWQIIGVWH